MLGFVKRRARRSKAAIIAYKIFDNWRRRQRWHRGDIVDDCGATHRGKPLATSVARVEAQFKDYAAYGRLGPGWFPGRRVLELGFGDNVGVALLFLAAGARSCVCLDRFYSPRDEGQQRRIYLELRRRLAGDEERRRFDEAIDLGSGVRANPERLREIYGVGLEGSDELLRGEPFDLAVSNAVVQSIYEPGATFAALDRVLKPGGLMLHKIDLGDYGMFSAGGMHPLTFLTISEPVYRLMASGSGLPNRKTAGYYRAVTGRLGYEAELLVTDVVGRQGKGDLRPHPPRLVPGEHYDERTLALVREIRPRLDERYAGLSDDELLVAGIFLVARKPA